MLPRASPHSLLASEARPWRAGLKDQEELPSHPCSTSPAGRENSAAGTARGWRPLQALLGNPEEKQDWLHGTTRQRCGLECDQLGAQQSQGWSRG